MPDTMERPPPAGVVGGRQSKTSWQSTPATGPTRQTGNRGRLDTHRPGVRELSPALHHFVTLDVILLDTVPKVVTADSQSASGFRLVPVVLLKGFDDHRALRRP